MLLKILIRKGYATYLGKRWHMSGGSGMLATRFLKDYKEFPFFKTFRVHQMGFDVSNWDVMGLDEGNYKDYLSTASYYGMHPLNGEYSKWIDDKLTLKYLCAGTELDKYMPAYYFQIDGAGRVLPLMDLPDDEKYRSEYGVAKLLREEKELAIKLIAGSVGEGFYKAEYREGQYLLNGRAHTQEEFSAFISKLRNYLITEYLRPHPELAKYCSGTVNCIRYLIGRIDGKSTLISSFIRFGTLASRFVENYGAGGVLCYLNDRGEFTEGNIIADNKNEAIFEHPDNRELLSGTIPHWDEIVEVSNMFGRYFPQMNYLGIDFVVTDKDTVKVLEINSLTSLDAIQLRGSILKTPQGAFYKQYMRS